MNGWMDGHTNVCILMITLQVYHYTSTKCPVSFPSMIPEAQNCSLCIIPMVKLCPSEGTAEMDDLLQTDWTGNLQQIVLNQQAPIQVLSSKSSVPTWRSKVDGDPRCYPFMVHIQKYSLHPWFSLLQPQTWITMRISAIPCFTRLHFQASLASWPWGLSLLADCFA